MAGASVAMAAGVSAFYYICLRDTADRRAGTMQMKLRYIWIPVILIITAGLCCSYFVFGKQSQQQAAKQMQVKAMKELQEPVIEIIQEPVTSEIQQEETEASESTEVPYDYFNPVPVSEAVEDSYFDDAVFIGDSRTEGFFLNAGPGDSRAYAYRGLTVETVMTKPVVYQDGVKCSAIDALRATSFSKVYIMLGINEIGWVYSDVFIEKYVALIDEIRSINPDAKIYLQSILPVSESVSTTHSYIKNDKIQEYNALIQQMAGEQGVYYLNVAEVMASEQGALPEDAAFDGIHLKREYCEAWLEYLRIHTVP